MRGQDDEQESREVPHRDDGRGEGHHPQDSRGGGQDGDADEHLATVSRSGANVAASARPKTAATRIRMVRKTSERSGAIHTSSQAKAR